VSLSVSGGGVAGVAGGVLSGRRDVLLYGDDCRLHRRLGLLHVPLRRPVLLLCVAAPLVDMAVTVLSVVELLIIFDLVLQT